MRKAVRTAAEAVADEHGFERAAFLAFVSVESGGRAHTVIDGVKRVVVRFEAHVFWEELPKDLRAAAANDGLASPTWEPKLAPATQRGVWELIERATEFCISHGLDPEAVFRSCSWGLLQVMGFNAERAGFTSARAMATACESVEGQLRAGASFMEVSGIATAVRAQDWKTAARIWNGPGYARLGYHTKLSRAYARFSGAPSLEVLRLGARGDAVMQVQRLVGVDPDGRFGPETDQAVRAYQEGRGLVADGIVGAKTWASLRERGANLSAVPEQDIAGRLDRIATATSKAAGAASAAASAIAALAGDDPTIRLVLIVAAIVAAGLFFAPDVIRRVSDALHKPEVPA